jgi:prolyl-tRNA synthetase
MNLQYADVNNKLQDVWMGSYGIGIGRTMAAIVEQNHDDKGIIWPENIAPYKAIILLMNSKDENQVALAEKAYQTLQDNGIEVILDDRDERPGVKFKDADLIGIPLRITVGRRAGEGIVELKYRKDGTTAEVSYDEAVKAVRELV